MLGEFNCIKTIPSAVGLETRLSRPLHGMQHWVGNGPKGWWLLESAPSEGQGLGGK